MRLPLVLEEALAFAERHPVGHLDAPTRRRLLTLLTSAPEGTFVLGDERGELALVATVVDVIADPAAPAQLVVLGARPELAAGVFVEEVLGPARDFAQSVGRHAMHVALPEFLRDADATLGRRGFERAHETLVMRRPAGPLTTPPSPLPSGWRWAPLDDARVPALHAALDEIFRDAPSITLPPLEAFRRGAFSSPPGWQLLLEGESVIGGVRVSADGARGELRVLGRSPAYRRRGLGALLVEHGLRLLLERGVGAVTLEVAATNERALALYRAFDFEIVERTPTFAIVL